MRIFNLLLALVAMEVIWGEKVKWVSKMTPKTRGVLSSGRGVGFPAREMVGWRWDWRNSGVKRVTDDFGADSWRRLSPTQDTTSAA